MHIGPEAKYFISVTWELTPPHSGGFCNYILSCQTLLLVVYHAPYVSHRDIIVVLISGPKPSSPEPMEIWGKRLVNNVPTICVLYNGVIRSATVVVLDMVAVTHIIKPQRASIFGEYTHMQLMPCLQELELELFRFISKELQRDTADLHYELLTTNADLVLSNKPTDMTALSPCQQEEADTRMMLHLYRAAGQGHSKAFLMTVDSDVVVLAINIFHQLRLSALWIGYGIDKTCKDIPIHHISHCEVLPFFHAFTGCDLVSSMLGIGKKTAWNAWNAYPKVTNTFFVIIQDPSSIILDSLHMRRLERWTVLMYSCDAGLLNDAMKVMFTHSLKSLDYIPPTQHALFQHTKRALLAAAFIWKRSLSKIHKIPKPSDWGWEWNTRTNQWVPFWTDLADVSHACSLLLHCGCVVACRGNCRCHRTWLRCNTLCKCEGGCTNNDNKALLTPEILKYRPFTC